jgi:hypothetical protein
MDGIRAAITGDFVLLADEVNPVVKALAENGITPTAIHSHMIHDEPEKLVKGLKAALDTTNPKH